MTRWSIQKGERTRLGWNRPVSSPTGAIEYVVGASWKRTWLNKGSEKARCKRTEKRVDRWFDALNEQMGKRLVRRETTPKSAKDVLRGWMEVSARSNR